MKTNLAVSIKATNYRSPSPTITISDDDSAATNHRLLRAVAFRLAAIIERASFDSGERWVVQVGDAEVYLELSTGSDAEAARGCVALQDAVKLAQAAHADKHPGVFTPKEVSWKSGVSGRRRHERFDSVEAFEAKLGSLRLQGIHATVSEVA